MAYTSNTLFFKRLDHLGGIMGSVLASNVIDHRFKSRSEQTKNYEIGICCLSDKDTSLMSKGKGWCDRNLDNIS